METLDAFLKAIAEGFNPSNRYIVAGVAIFLGFVVLAIVANRIVMRREKRIHRRQLDEKYQRLIRKLNLTIRELDFIDKLAEFLEDGSKKYLLLVNPQTLATCVRAFRKSQTVATDTVKDLEAHLGFEIPDVPKPKNSTRRLSPGTAVRLHVLRRDTKLTGAVSAQFPDSLVVILDNASEFPHAGDEVILYSGDYRGFVGFKTTVTSIHENEVKLAHADRTSEELNLEKPVPVNLDIVVRSDDPDEKAVPAQVISLFSRGANVVNPDRRFRKGDDVRLYFRRAKNSWRQVNAEVVSLERRRRVMRVRFSHVKQSIWEDIVGVRPPVRGVKSET